MSAREGGQLLSRNPAVQGGHPKGSLRTMSANTRSLPLLTLAVFALTPPVTAAPPKAKPAAPPKAPAPPASASPNLLLNNPGFEAAAVPGHGHGPFALPGWDAEQYDYGWTSVGVAEDDAPEGKRRLYLNSGGRATTAAGDRAVVQPGRLYRMRFEAKTAREDFPGNYDGITPSLLFYDKDGKLVQEVKRLDVEAGGVFPWQAFTLDAVAPPGAARAGVQVTDSGGNWPHPGTRAVSVDDFSLAVVPETRDTVTVRRAARLIERGRAADVKVKYTATGARDVVAQLLFGAKIVAGARTPVTAGRGLAELSVPVPPTAPLGDRYVWRVGLAPSGGSATHLLGPQTVAGGFADEKMVGSGTVGADSPDILYAGRWDRHDPKNPVCYWGGSQILTRFRGTSVGVKMSASGDDQFLAVIDGDVDGMRKFTVQNGQATVATGLTPGTHSLVLMRNAESTSGPATFQGFVLDPGQGLLRPAPLPTRRIEFYGDSITSGGAPDPKKASPDVNNDGDYDGNFDRTYAAFTARELGADWHPISKGGTGVAGSWVFKYTLLDYWDKLDFDGWDPSKARLANFAAWQPQAVVITVGHNDRFRAPSKEAWVKNYAALVDGLHRVYPQSQVFCSNTAMSSDRSYWGAALLPLLPTRPWLHYQLFDPDQGHGGHPRLADHQGMAFGTKEWQSMADWIGDVMGW